MSLAQILQQTGAIDSMARELGIDEQTARMGAGALLPAIVAGMGRTTAGSGDMGGLGSIIGSLGGGGMLESVLGGSPTPVNQGNDILGNIFGSKDTSRSVAGEVAAVTGIDESLLKKMLPILAMAVAGYMAKQATGGASAPASGNSDGGLGGALGGALGGSLGGGALGGILGSIVSGMARR